MKPNAGYYQFSHLPIGDRTLKRLFTDVIGVREEVAKPLIKKEGPYPWLVFLCTEAGEEVYECKKQRILERPGSFRVQPRSLTYAERTLKTPWRIRYLLLRGPMAEEFQHQFWRTGNCQTDVYDTPPAAFRKLLVELVELTFDQPSGWPWRFLSRVCELFEVLVRCPPSDRSAGDLLDRAQRLIDAQTDNPWRLNDLAAELSMDAKTLTRRFQRIVGQPPAAWARRRRMDLALTFLHQGMSVAAVSDQLGFADPSCFSRQFIAVMGMPPSTVRRAPPLRR